ncbi:MAG: aminopeptidase P family protein [Acidobacteria bacterium]|nr:aminopeptidase P family protein [Acidobacteriota bacterium]
MPKRKFYYCISLAAWFAASLAAWAQQRESPNEYESRRTALREKLDNGFVILYGNSEPPGSEAYHRFWQESNFYYLSGYAEPGAVLLVAPRKTRASLPEEILFLPERNPQEEPWTGVKPDPGDPVTAVNTGFARVQGMKTLESEVARYAKQYSSVYTLLPNPHTSEPEGAVAQVRLDRLKKLLPSKTIRDAHALITGLRQVKSDSEIKLIRRAADCTIEAQQEALKKVRPGLFEYEIAALIKYTFERSGCERPSFDPIIGSGPRSTVLHYNRNSAQMQEGDLVVMDVGAEYGRYAADITRTVPVNGRFTARQREIYEIVLGAQKAAIAAVRPGMKLFGRGSDSLHQIAYNYINTHGKDRDGKSLGRYFIHGLSHHVGLDVHDPAQLNAALEPGMVITIEPGIYLPEENIGVRIEDMVLVTEDGYELLTEILPSEVEEIERLMAQ